MRGVIPSTLLPPLPRAQYTLEPLTPSELLAHMALLRELYMPPIHGGFTASDVNVEVEISGRKRTRTLSGGAVDLPGLELTGLTLNELDEDGDSADEDDNDPNDPFEREWAEKWLNGVVRRAQVYLEDHEDPEIESVLREATAVLAMMAGTSAAGSLTRHLAFPLAPELATNLIKLASNPSYSPETNKFLQSLSTSPVSPVARLATLSTSPIRTSKSRQPVLPVLLHDAPMGDHLSVGVQTWGSAILLGRELALNPAKFGLFAGASRVLELGAGTGLLSILCRKLLDLKNAGGIVVATDFLPDVLENLRVCVDLNAVNVEIAKLDWTTFPSWMARRAGEVVKPRQTSGTRTPRLATDPPTGSSTPREPEYTRVLETQSSNPGLARRVLERLEAYVPPEDEELAAYPEPFDLVIASDCVYDPTHAEMLREVASWVLRLPENGDGGGTFASVVLTELTIAHSLSDPSHIHARAGVDRCCVHPARQQPTEPRTWRGTGQSIRIETRCEGWEEGRSRTER